MAALKIRDIVQKLPKNKFKKYKKRNTGQIKYIVVHHSAIDGYGAFDYADWHIKKGWPGIGYHFVIGKDGEVDKTNELETVSYHVGDRNLLSIGIALTGNLSKHPPTGLQVESLVALIKELKHTLGPHIQVRGHREFMATECPGKMMDMDMIRNLVK